jgi:hypothetical protein
MDCGPAIEHEAGDLPGVRGLEVGVEGVRKWAGKQSQKIKEERGGQVDPISRLEQDVEAGAGVCGKVGRGKATRKQSPAEGGRG